MERDADVDALWDLDRLFQTPHYRETGEAEVGVRSILYEGEPYRGRASQVFAYLGVPAPPVPAAPNEVALPGMVLVHGGGGTAFREWVAMWNARGYAAIAMDLGGCGAGRAPLADGGPPQSEEAKFGDPVRGWRDHWVYHAVANVVRAHSLLRSLPGVDPRRIGLTGISWGGYLTLIAAGLDGRFGGAAPVYGCGFLQDNSVWSDERGSFAAMSEEGRAAWHARCDPSRYAGRATMPLLFVSRPTDVHYRLDSLARTYRLVRAPLHLAIRVGLGHSHPHGWSPPEIARFADSLFRGAPGLPRLDQPTPASSPAAAEGSATLRAAYAASRPLARADLAFTLDGGPWPERTWRHAPAEVAADDGPAGGETGAVRRGELRAAVPRGATAAFFAAFDDLGGYASSPHVVVEGPQFVAG